MPWENPWAYDEARKRIREKVDRETIVIEEKKEDFEKTKEKIYSKKKLDVFELKRRIETGNSLGILKSDIRTALENGDISIDTYRNALKKIENTEWAWEKRTIIEPEYTVDPTAFPLSDHPLTRYFESQKLWANPFIDLAGFAYGFAQGSIFLLYLAGKIVIDALLLPVDIYKMMQK